MGVGSSDTSSNPMESFLNVRSVVNSHMPKLDHNRLMLMGAVVVVLLLKLLRMQAMARVKPRLPDHRAQREDQQNAVVAN